MGKLESDLCSTSLAILCPQVSLVRAVKEVQNWKVVFGYEGIFHGVCGA